MSFPVLDNESALLQGEFKCAQASSRSLIMPQVITQGKLSLKLSQHNEDALVESFLCLWKRGKSLTTFPQCFCISTKFH
jgi:hypothetical protein